MLGNRSAYLEAIFATARLGAIAVPINARFTGPEVRRVLDDCTPRVLLHESALREVAENACRERPRRRSAGPPTTTSARSPLPRRTRASSRSRPTLPCC